VLESLDIRNLATVAELSVEFAPGLNVLTGETGAGKSVIIGALQALLGDRAEKSLVRRGEASCEITAALRILPEYQQLGGEVAALLEAAGLPPCEDGLLLLRRVITPSGSRAYVNATAVTLQVLRGLGDLLVDIHGPHDHQSLLSPRCQLSLLDAYAALAAPLAACDQAFRKVQDLEARMERLRQEHLSEGESEILRHQLREITDAELSVDEESELLEKHRFASHAQRLLEISGECCRGLTEEDDSICDQLGRYVRLLEEMAELAGTAGANCLEQLETLSGGLRDVSREIAEFADSLEVDSESLARLEERLGLIHRLKRKYGGGSLDAVREYARNLEERLSGVDNREALLAELEQQVREAGGVHRQLSSELSRQRKSAAGQLAAAIAGKLSRLGFEQSCFDIRFTDCEPGPAGQDRIEFCFAPNPGEEVMPLRKIASSGEIARVMLAVKTVLSAADQVPILIFDEVDANVGGRTAGSVASELAAIASRHQVLCITHLPQIAAAAVTHYRVGKHIAAGRTLTTLETLDHDGRVSELKRMMGADEDSTAARQHAEELLAGAKNI
jgi:DNA repair protein RecN (Recombination protein N)